VANHETARRGIVLSFVSSLLQSLVAVLIVAIGAWLLNITAGTMCGAERVIAIASYALIAAFGARLVWTKGAAFMRALQVRAATTDLALASVAPAKGRHDHAELHHHVHDDHGPDHSHGQDHVHDGHC